MTFGLSALGWNPKRLADVVTSLDNNMLTQFGEVNLDPQSVFGQFVGSLSKAFADDWDNMTAIYGSSYPNSAYGVSLDNVVQLNGISRLPATQTMVYAVCTGSVGTLIPVGALASIPSLAQSFYCTVATVISNSTAYDITAEVTSVTTQPYVVQINGQNFIYSLPIITFTGSFVTSNSTVVTLNGISLAAVPFNTNNNQTVMDIATKIATSPAVASATATGSVIDIIPNAGFQVVINSIVITGGASQPSWAITYAAPADAAAIVNALVAIINAGTQPVTASNVSNNLYIVVDIEDVPITTSFNGTVGANMLLIEQSTVALFAAEQYGPIPCPVGALNYIQTPIAGWNTVNNPIAGVTGTLIETDSALRLRRLASISSAGNATVASIEAHLLAIPGVTAATVYENYTVTQDDIIITLGSSLVIGNQIVVSVNSTVLPTVTFFTSNNATMTQIAQLIQAQPGIADVTLSGSPYNELDISMVPFANITITQFTISLGTAVIVFDGAFVTGNVITVTLNGTPLTPVNFTTDSPTTLAAVATVIAAQTTPIASATPSGGTTITVIPNSAYTAKINDIVITGGASQPTYTVTYNSQALVNETGGRPAKSFEAVVQGGNTNAIGEAIWLSKPAGIQTFGNTEVIITDSEGNPQTIFYSVPSPVYIWVEVVITLYTKETFPVDGLQQVAQAILNYGNSLAIGENVILQRVNSQIFTVPGIDSGTMQIAGTFSPNLSPSYGTADIVIGDNQISVWSLSRITVTM